MVDNSCRWRSLIALICNSVATANIRLIYIRLGASHNPFACIFHENFPFLFLLAICCLCFCGIGDQYSVSITHRPIRGPTSLARSYDLYRLNVIECSNTLITWQGGVAPYSLSLQPGKTSSHHEHVSADMCLKDTTSTGSRVIASIAATSYLWTVDEADGQ